MAENNTTMAELFSLAEKRVMITGSAAGIGKAIAIRFAEAGAALELAVNLDAVYWMCQEMIRRRRKDGGVIVNIGSIGALVPFNDDLTHTARAKRASSR